MKTILYKLAQNPSQYEEHPSYYEEILCKVLTVYFCFVCFLSSHGKGGGAAVVAFALNFKTTRAPFA